jgi:hypothetical protein
MLLLYGGHLHRKILIGLESLLAQVGVELAQPGRLADNMNLAAEYESQAEGAASRLTRPTITAWDCFRPRARPPRSPWRALGSPC